MRKKRRHLKRSRPREPPMELLQLRKLARKPRLQRTNELKFALIQNIELISIFL